MVKALFYFLTSLVLIIGLIVVVIGGCIVLKYELIVLKQMTKDEINEDSSNNRC